MRNLSLTAGLLASALVTAAAVKVSHAAPPACHLDAAMASAAGPDCAEPWMDRHLRLNDLFTVGTHNSYKQAIPPADYAVIAAVNPTGAAGLDYAHKTLTAELDAGARQLEIDVVYDPQGGRYTHPEVAALTHMPLDPSWTAAMQQPGFKVLHVPDFDFRSSCLTFKQCLGVIRQWSDAHPRHTPITILVNAKDGRAAPGGVPLLPFDGPAFDAFDTEIREVLPPSKLVTPNDVQGRYPTLRDAVLHNNWPTLGASRGHILFALDESPEKVAIYRGNRGSLEGRVAFINTDEQSPAAAYLTLNDPVKQSGRIAADVRAGFLVRTRADSDTVQARSNDTGHRDAALRSGAQMVSTDYLWPDPRFSGGFAVRLPDHLATICNPVRASGKCGGLPVERIADADWQRAEAAPMTLLAPRGAGGMSAAGFKPYLPASALPDATRILPQPPADRSPLAAADAAVFRRTRALKGSPRWVMATADVNGSLQAMLDHFSCAIGMLLKPSDIPATAHLFVRMAATGAGFVQGPKDHYHRRRPYVGTGLPICEPETDHLAADGDYPSGHTTAGWTTALVLTELLPDRATGILARGRAYGESRAICGSHSVSAVQAGYMTAASYVAALHGSADYRHDLDTARAELAALRTRAPAPAAEQCSAEVRLIAGRAW
ncbi:Ca2+-dependent phosphoinositide-specific phospholipase C [Sphingomonas sp. PB2P12]|uniref:Ca2+-dependent phosphoinositide-specific phospholipase C n=1 Tax=Sphingomonas sandaracina TaxID=3096157 RepID=UPI002FC6B317